MKRWITDQKEIEDILDRALVGRLGTVVEGVPYVVPLHFVHQDNKILFHSGLSGKKLSAFQNQEQVCFEVDELEEVVANEHACLFTSHYQSVILWGTARMVNDPAAKQAGLNRLVEKYAKGQQVQPIPEQMLEIVNLCEIEISELTAKAKSPDS
jgi:nitroimidazol reductase NimA-like FMN-containing flavoprotein (pyridoxamine 5'-phosphate oxidase superfamily)